MRSLPTIIGNLLPQNIPTPTSLSNSTSWSKVSAGQNFSVAIDSSKKLYAWGTNTTYQLGDNTTLSRSSPVQIGNISYGKLNNSFTQVSAGFDHAAAIDSSGSLWTWGNYASVSMLTNLVSWQQISTHTNLNLAIRSDGSLFAWGQNAGGQVGDGTTINKSSPVQINAGTSWSSVSAGVSHSLAIRNDGTLWTWGLNGAGELGLTTDTISRSRPVQVAGSWSLISAGTSYSLALDSTNKLYGWGLNSSFQLADTTNISKSAPVLIGTSSWNVVSAGFQHALGVTVDGKLFAWGGSTSLGIAASPISWSQISVGTSHALGIRNDGLLYGWGLNTSGQLGDGTAIAKSNPVQIGSSSWSSVSAGDNHSLAINSLGKMFAWGSGTSMQTGLGGVVTANQETLSRSSPIQIGTANSWSQVSAGTSYSLARTTTNLLYGWGLNTSNQLGDSTTIAKSSPIQIGTSSWNSISSGFDHALAIGSDNKLYGWGNYLALNLAGTNFSWTQISNGSSHTLAIRSDGLLFGWGLNSAGQLGLTTDTIARSSPVQIGTGSWTSVNAGVSHTVGIRNTGALFAWGLNSSGELGLTTDNISRSSPVQIGTDSWYSVSSGNSFTVAIRSDRTLWSWGANAVWQLGLGSIDTINRSSPTQIGTSSWTSVNTGFDHTVAIDITNKLYAWGNPNAVVAPIPTTIKSWTQVSAAPGTSGSHTVAIDSVGGLYTWGDNSVNARGALGTNDSFNRSSPVQIGTSSWGQVSAGGTYTVAKRIDGTLWAWGNNVSGVLGDGTLTSKSTPVQITTGSWLTISAGNDHTLAVRSDRTLWTWGNSTATNIVTNTFSWSVVTSGSSHTLAIRSDGGLFAWGLGTTGQLGLGDVVTRSSPVQVGTSSWTSVSANNLTTAAIRIDNTLWVWGNNSSYQLGDSTTVFKSSPVQVAGTWNATSVGADNIIAINNLGLLYGMGSNAFGQSGFGYSWTMLYSGAAHSAGIRNDGTLWTWGINVSGQLGDGTTINKSNPVQILGSWTKVSAGQSHNLAIDSSGKLWSWGLNALGQLGLTTDTISRSAPVQVGTSNWTSIVAGSLTSGSASMAIRSDSTAWAWGLNSAGQLGDNTTINKSSPVQVSTGLVTSWTQLGIGSVTSAGIDTLGRLYGWGAANLVGDNTTIAKSVPVQLAVGTSFTQVNTKGSSYTVAIDSVSKMWTWGLNNTGQLGFNDTILRSSPAQIPVVGTGSWTQIDVGSSWNIGLQNNGTVWTWGGYTTSGFNLGDLTTVNRSSPAQIASGSSFKLVTAGTGGGFAVSIDNSLWSWGLNSDGRLGNNAIAVVSPAAVRPVPAISFSGPVQVTTGGSWSSVSAGWSFTQAINNTNKLFTFGNNTVGQLGDGTTINKMLPTQIGTSSWTAVSSGFDNALAIRGDGGLFSWGNNAAGVVGDGTTINKSNPVQINAGTSWIRISSGGISATSQFASALQANSTLWTWGFNTQGQLGLTTDTITRSAPVQVGTGSWSKIGSGGAHLALVDSNNLLYGTGLNVSGQLGINNAISRSNPVITRFISAALSPSQIYTGFETTSWNLISAGTSYSVTTDSNNKIWVWGLNSSGQLGLGDTIARSSPTQISAVTSWTSISASLNHTAAVRNDGTLWVWGSQPAISIMAIYPSSWAQISITGGTHALGIKNDGTLWSWGINTQGQVGDNSAITKSSPVLVSGGGSWSQIRATNSYSQAIRNDGTLWSWGGNTLGQVGDGTTINKSTPVQIAGSWTKISAGYSHVMALDTSNNIYAWGFGTLGQLGDNTLISKSSPVLVAGGGNWTSIATLQNGSLALNNLGLLYSWGNSAAVGLITIPYSWTSVTTNNAGVTAAIRNDGLLFTWGAVNLGQLGLNSGVTSRNSPTQLGTSSWSQVSLGENASAAGIQIDGTLWTWGQNVSGELGISDTINRSSPVQVPGSWSQVSVGGSGTIGFMVGKTSTGSLYAWGNNAAYTLGDATTINKSSPVLVSGTKLDGTIVSSWSQISAGALHSLATDQNGYIYGWGQSSSLATYTDYQSWSQLTVGTGNAAGIRTDGALFFWGSSAGGGALGGATVPSRSAPTQLPGNQSWTSVNITSNGQYLALRSDKKLFTWGVSNSRGYQGQGDTISRSSPVLIGTDNWITATLGYNAAAGIKEDGSLWAWGYNIGNILLDASTSTSGDRSSPVQIWASSGYSWTNVAINISNGLAIQSDGSLWGWGGKANNANGTGVIGDGTTISRTTFMVPIGVSLGKSWTKVYSTGSSRFAIATDSTLWAWGSGTTGNLGQNDTIARSEPVQIPGSWTQIAYAEYTDDSIVGIKTDGSLWLWGTPSAGTNMFLDGIGVPRSSPVQITSGSGWWPTNTTFKSVAYERTNTGNPHIHAITTDGEMYVWGDNISGVLGDGTVVTRSSPVLVRNLNEDTLAPKQLPSLTFDISTSIAQVSAGLSYSAVITSDNKLFTWGLNSAGQIGDGTTITKSKPIQVSGSWTAVAIATSTTSALDTTGTLYAWGSQGTNTGTFLVGDTLNRSAPVSINAGITWNTASIKANVGFGIKNDGILYAWGLNTTGQLGDRAVINRSSPVVVNSIPANRSNPTQIGEFISYTQISSGLTYTIALRPNNTLWAWGLNTSGQLGDGTTIDKSAPVQIPGSWSQLYAGQSTAFAISSTGKLYAWGFNSVAGNIGDNTTVSKSSPVLVAVDPTFTFTSFNGDTGSAGAIRNNGQVYIWGTGITLGDTTTANRSSPAQLGMVQPLVANTSSPVQVGLDSNYSQVFAGISNTLVLKTNGSLFAWGVNDLGQLGDNTSINRSSPVLVGTAGTSWISGSAGGRHFGFITNTNLLYLSGWNSTAQLGLGTVSLTSGVDNITRSNPTLLGGQININTMSPILADSGSWTQIAAGQSFSLAIKSDSSLWTWGLNASGQLGSNDTLARSSIVQIGAGISWTDVQTAQVGATSFAETNNLTWYAWGTNQLGLLGYNADTIARSSPVLVGSTFIDNSQTVVSIQFVGKPTTTTIVPYTPAVGFSTVLTPTDSITFSHPLLDAVNNDFTLEFYFYPTAFPASGVWLLNKSGIVSTNFPAYGIEITNVTGAMLFVLGDSTGGVTRSNYNFATSLTLNTWNHIAVVRRADIIYTYINGVVTVGGLARNVVETSLPLVFAGQRGLQGGLTGYVSSLRYVPNLAVYDITGFTVPTTPLQATQSASTNISAITSGFTELLTFQNNIVGRSWTQLSVGNSFATVIDSSNLLWGWGDSSTGQLGNLTTISQSSPVQVNSITQTTNTPIIIDSNSWSVVSAGQSHSTAIRSNSLYVWGQNTVGQLGTSDTINRSAPTQVPGNWSTVTASNSKTDAISTNSTLYTWGTGNATGHGILSVVNRSQPTLIGTYSTDDSSNNYPMVAVGELLLTSQNPFGSGQSLVFNGISNYITIPYVPRLYGSFTVEFYFYPTTSIGARALFGTYAAATTGAGNTLIQLDTNNNLVWNYDGSTAITGSTKPTVNQWNHVVACRDSSTNLYLYLNGSLVATGSFTGLMFGGTATSIFIGAQQLAPLNYFKGYISAIRVNDAFGNIYSGDPITVPTSSLTNIDGTSLLTLQNLYNTSYTQVSSKNSTVVAIRDNNLIYSWGNNSTGSLGDGTTITKSSPVLLNSLVTAAAPVQIISVTGSWSTVSAGTSHSLAIRQDGSLYAWGLNTFGQLGENTTISKSVPVQIGTSSWSQVRAGSSATIGVTADNKLFAWGLNASGQLGDGTIVNRSRPNQIAAAYTITPASISLGSNGSTQAFITTDGSLYAIGVNTDHQINNSAVNISTPTLVGYNNLNTNTAIPTQVGNISWLQVSAGLSATGAVSAGASLYVWGLNNASQLGLGDIIARSSPTLLSAVGDGYSQIDIGTSVTFAIKADGTLYGTGLGNSGQIGDGYSANKPTLTQIGNNNPGAVVLPKQLGTKTFTSADAGNSYSMAIDSTGILYAWGVNASGQLGLGDYIGRSSPVAVAAALPIYFNRRSLGFDHVIMTRNDGTLYGWGNNSVGQVLQSVTTVIQSWSQVASAEAGSHTVAIRNDGSLWTWGLNSSGQLGTADTLNRSSPVQIGADGASWTTITAGAASSYAIRTDGKLFAWGNNSVGQIGDNTSINKSAPTQVGNISWLQLSGGGTGTTGHILALRSDNTLYAWGWNNSGQLGLTDSVPAGATLNRSSPVLVGTSSWSQISAGVSHSMGITPDGILWGWGGNTTGQLGIIVPFTVPNGTTISRSSPTQISVDKSWSAVSSGSGHTLGIDSTGLMFAWGQNNAGQLGTASLGTINRSSPVQIGNNLWGNVIAGQSYSMALTANGNLWGWGLNTGGILGDGSTITRSSPIQVGSLNWKQISTGGTTNNYGIRSDSLMFAWGSSSGIGQLGLTSDTIARSSPTLIGNNTLVATTIPNPVQISTSIYSAVNAGQSNSQVITLTGLLFAWGLNSSGQLGLTDTINRSSPVQVGTGSWSAIGTNYTSGLGVRQDGTLYAWGAGNTGQLGVVSTVAFSSPVQIGGNYYQNAATPIQSPLYSWTSISAGNSFSMAIRNDGKLFTWGADVGGQVGDKTTINKSQPTQIGTSNWSIISAGGSNSSAITS